MISAGQARIQTQENRYENTEDVTAQELQDINTRIKEGIIEGKFETHHNILRLAIGDAEIEQIIGVIEDNGFDVNLNGWSLPQQSEEYPVPQLVISWE